MESIKELFDLLHKIGEGLYGNIHILELDAQYDYDERMFCKRVYRVYHSSGYCFEVEKLKTDEPDVCSINNHDYYFNSDMFDGFKKIKDAEHAICLIKNEL